MVKVTLALPDGRSTVLCDANKSIKSCLDNNSVSIGRATVMLDGTALDPESLRKSFADFGINDDCTIAICAKLQNA